MNKPVVNIAASVRQRLFNLSRERKEDFGLVLTKYGLERVLYRIGQSKHRELFVLKGALLFELWTEQRYRPTRDADFLAHGQNSPERFVEVFREICGIEVAADGLEFDPAGVTAERITEDADYEGIRLKFIGQLENARISIQIDLGFGDVITPGLSKRSYQHCLICLRQTCSPIPESVIAEKLEALVSLGMANSRMKDLYDIRSLAREFSFDGGSLSKAVVRTFKRRETKLPDGKPLVFTAEFFSNEDKKRQWSAFCAKNKSYMEEIPLQKVCEEIEIFLSPALQALANDATFLPAWKPGSGWK